MDKNKKALNKRVIQKYLFVYGMLAYTLIHFIVFYIYVNLSSFSLAFVDKITGGWNAFANFKFFFKDFAMGKDSVILANLGNTMKYFLVNTVCQLPIAMLLAYFLYKKILGHKFFMIIFMIPMLISTVVLADIYIQALSKGGVVGIVFQRITGSEKSLLNNVDTATPSILMFCLWTGFGLNLIMFNGSMSRIPESVVESAKLEGVGFWKELFSITVPMIWPTFSMLMLLSVTSVFASTGPIVLFADQADFDIGTIDFWMYKNVAAATGAQKEYNLASALGLILTVASLPIFLFVMWLRKKLDQNVTY